VTKLQERTWRAYFSAFPLLDGERVDAAYEVGYLDGEGSKVVVHRDIVDLTLRATEHTWISVEFVPKTGEIALHAEPEGLHPRWRVAHRKAELCWAGNPIRFADWDNDPAHDEEQRGRPRTAREIFVGKTPNDA